MEEEVTMLLPNMLPPIRLVGLRGLGAETCATLDIECRARKGAAEGAMAAVKPYLIGALVLGGLGTLIALAAWKRTR